MVELINHTVEEIWSALENVKDPEIPVLTVVDMGIITSVEISGSIAIVTMTPTFVGCPAIGVMKKSIQEEVSKLGFEEVVVHVDFETQWTSDRMKPEAKKQIGKIWTSSTVYNRW